jgi:dTDP-4-dehydrorhamnose 3,5-epimerase
VSVRFIPTRIPQVILCEHDLFADPRGFFEEVWRQSEFEAAGMGPFVQSNRSRSARGVIRGLHYQLRHPQGKLICVMSGTIYDVALDLRRGAPTFGQWVGLTLSATDGRQLYVPPGFAHGFCVVSESADVLYLCTEYYLPKDERGVLWSDSLLAIPWPTDTPVVSERDARLPRLSSVPDDDLPRYAQSWPAPTERP